MLRTLSCWGHPVGQGHEFAVGAPGCGKGRPRPLFEFLAEVEEADVEDMLFQLADTGSLRFGFVGACDAVGVEYVFAEDLGQAGGEVDVLPLKPLVLFSEVGQVGEQGLPARGGGCGAVLRDGRMRVDLSA